MSRQDRSLARSGQFLLLAALAWSASACAATVSAGIPGPVYSEGRHDEGRYDYDGGPLSIPPGHLPPPGECRVWYPGVPPGQQPPPTSCDRAMYRAPAGAWVLYRPDRKEVHTRVIHDRRPGVVVDVRVFDAQRGRYLRSRRP